MRAALLRDIEKIEILNKAKPQVKGGSVIVKVEYCGICGSDVHSYLDGIMISVGTVMGHECSGTVVEVGEAVKNYRAGDRVAVMPLPHCTECYWCKKGQYSLCNKIYELGIGVSPAHDGGYAEYLEVQHPDQMLYRLPDHVTYQQGALVEPLSPPMHAIRMSSFRPGDNTVVIGAGMMGLGTIQFLKLGGAGKIIALEVSSKKAELSLEIGADVVLDPNVEGQGLRERILDLTDGVGADVVFECAGVPFAFQNAMFFAKKGGQVILIGVNEKEVAIDPFPLVLYEIDMKGVAASYDEFKYVIRYLEQRKIATDLLISGIVPLEDIEEKGFKRLLAYRDDVKILVRP